MTRCQRPVGQCHEGKKQSPCERRATALVELEEYRSLQVNPQSGHVSIRTGRENRLVTVHFRSLSHMWESREHPDPWRYQLQVVAKCCEPLLKKGAVWIFIDFISLYQYKRNGDQGKIFKKAMNLMHILYSHEIVEVDIIDELTPSELQVHATIKAYDEKHGMVKPMPIDELKLNDKGYACRGWCQAERQWARLRILLQGAIPTPPDMFRKKMQDMEFTHRDDKELVPCRTTRLLYVVANGNSIGAAVAVALVRSGGKDIQMELCDMTDDDALQIAEALMSSAAGSLPSLSLAGNRGSARSVLFSCTTASILVVMNS
eukprot:Skav212742  [mRNA]  locus=scaffold1199:147398:148903:+ [translate_table: standard]